MAESIPISETKNLRVLNTRVHQDRRNAISQLRPICGLDTETYKGDIFLIADSEGRFLDKITPKSVINWLFSRKYQGTWNFFYNLGYDAENILKLLGSTLEEYKKTRRLVFPFDDYKLEYILDKKLSIKKGHHSSIFYDIFQFYNTSIVAAYQNNIGSVPDHYLKTKKKRNEFSNRYYLRNKIKIRNYCILDCIFAKQLAEHWIKLFNEAFSFYPSKWISSGYLAEKVLINNQIEIPKFNTVPYKIQEFAFRSYFGGRFEILKRGFIGTAYLYDINSAYPFALTTIPNLHKGEWIRRKTINPNAKIGFFRIHANIPDCKYIPPFPFRKNNSIIFPSGKFETYVTLPELKACENKDFYKILDSYQFISASDEYPYKEFISNLYHRRLELKRKNDPLDLPLKNILNSIYGKTGQKVNRRIGSIFNPIIFSHITGHTRSKLYRFVLENNLEREVVAFATDSICTPRKVGVNSNNFGEFCLEKEADDTFYLQNGFYRMNGKWKQRGLGRLGTKEIEHLDTFEKNGKLHYRFKVLRNNRLRSSIIQKRISDIGKIKESHREINPNADTKRVWLGEIHSINEKIMNESIPISLNYFKLDSLL